ncbi:MAG: class I SAM-dependent methyltransferase [Parachlamydiaceae bacterium]|nr:class I SAM-dependent methyltransferase [Parachlamydiaceae bacterium]
MSRINLIKLFLVFQCMFVTTISAQKKCSPYDIGAKLVPYSQSDLFKNQTPLASIIEKNKIKTIIEIGSWYGESTIFMASVLPKGGKVFAVDSWIGYPRHTYKNTRNNYEKFLSNVVHVNLTNRIVPIRMTSLSASKIFQNYFNQQVDMVYIDGDHTYKAVYCDLLAWNPYVKPDGVICGNLFAKDAEDTKQIQKAIKDYCKKYSKVFVFEENFWQIK